MKLPLSKSGYRLNRKTNVWSRPDYIGIAYSDGDEVEQRIAAVIEQASDLTVLSTELRQHCIDWPSLYHLSGTRSNILRPFQRTLAGAEVLEIGAGCGAITRYLGECGANVLALEGSPRRAAIARSRTRGLPNVMVVADRFDQFNWDQKFDVISLIGVLEYANLFTPAGDPALAMLKRVRAMLKPNGKLIIAIENQLGLKYFAGATEDHLGQPMVGIEGRYRKDQPQTWGRKVLTGMLEDAGFAASKFLAPFPDYKLPVSILTEEGFSNKNFDAAAFAWQSARRDPQLPAYCNFSLELAWPEVFRNELGLDVANSFLIIASPDAKQLIPTGVLAYHYSVERIPAYCKETVFIPSDGGDIHVEYRRLGTPTEDADKANNPLIKFILPDSDDYVFGRPLSLEFISIVTRDGWTFDQVARFISRYLSIVETFAKSAGIQISMTSPYAELPGEFFDVISQNIIIREDDSPSLIDKEWQLANPIEIGHLLFRSLLPLINSVTRFGQPVSQTSMTRYQLIDGTFAAADLRLQEEDYDRYIKLEADIQQSVTGRAAEIFLNWAKNYPLPILNLSQAVAERDEQIACINQAVAERDSQIGSLNQGLSERDGRIAGLNQAVAVRDQAVAERDGQIANLNQAVAERDGQIACINQAVAERDSQIGSLNQGLSERDGRIAGLNQAVAECDEQIACINQAVAEREGQIAGLGQSLLERDGQIANFVAERTHIFNSTNWRITKPLRYFRRIILRFNVFIRRYLSDAARYVWRKIPLSVENKMKIKNIVFRTPHFDDNNKIFIQNVSRKNLSPASEGQRIKIAAVTMVYNEAFMLPYFLRHYQYLDKIHVLYETDSTDDSLEILNRAQNVVIENCHIEGGLDDIEKIRIINNTLHGIEADWVYVLDPDEFVFSPGESPYDFLKRQNYDVVRSTMYQVYRHRTDKDLDPLLPPIPQRIHGDQDLFSTVKESNRAANSVYIKPNIVRPSSRIRFFPGHHDVEGAPLISPESFIGAHWHMADPAIAVHRRMERTARISERNKANQMGWQNYDLTEDKIRAECERYLDAPIIEVLRSFSEERLLKS
jgi:2-polyprenyl-3-methyl-5-hydroxy-6-metoxy-1,4-benzoquinol methylase/uncharacterized coiled-coil protein SlyX